MNLDWLDALLHTLLGIGVAAGFHYIGGYDWPASVDFGVWSIFVREFAQGEMDDEGKVSFLRGLAVWRWGLQKHFETWAPMTAVKLSAFLTPPPIP